jgi:NitT/TauT family transport system substrate-binding protein
MHPVAQGMRRFFATLALLACTQVQAQEIVRIGDLGITADAPFYIAAEKGWFREVGIDARLEKFGSLTEAMAPLSTGELHVLGGGISAALFNAFARGWPVRIAMGRTRDVPGFSSNVLVEIVYMPWPNMGPAFEKGAIDAGTMVEPFVTQFQERGIAQSFRRAAQVLDKPYLDASVVLYNSDWAAKSPKAAAGFTVAYLRGARHFHDALHGGPARAEVVDLLIRNTRLKEKALYDRMEISIVDPNGRMSKESLRDQQEWHARNGSVPRRANIEEMVDERWVREALARLGSVPERR